MNCYRLTRQNNVQGDFTAIVVWAHSEHEARGLAVLFVQNEQAESPEERFDHLVWADSDRTSAETLCLGEGAQILGAEFRTRSE